MKSENIVMFIAIAFRSSPDYMRAPRRVKEGPRVRLALRNAPWAL